MKKLLTNILFGAIMYCVIYNNVAYYATYSLIAEHMAAETITRVGPGGQYLMDAHTIRHIRTEMVFPRLSDRSSRDPWKRERKMNSCRRRSIKL